MKKIEKKIKSNFVLNTPDNLDNIKENIGFNKKKKRESFFYLTLAFCLLDIFIACTIIVECFSKNEVSASAKEAISYLDKSPIVKIDDASSFISPNVVITEECEIKEIIDFQIKIKNRINEVNKMFDYKQLKGRIKELGNSSFEKRGTALEANFNRDNRMIFNDSEETAVFANFDGIYYIIEESDDEIKVFIDDSKNNYTLFYECDEEELEIFENDRGVSVYLSLEKEDNNEQIGCYVKKDIIYAISIKNDIYSIYNNNGLKSFNSKGLEITPEPGAFHDGKINEDFEEFLGDKNRFDERKIENDGNKDKMDEILEKWDDWD